MSGPRPQLHSLRMRDRGLLALLAAALLALGMVACGSEGEEIPSSEADRLLAQLDELQAEVDAEDCEAADSTLTEVNGSVQDLGDEVDRDIRRTLRDLTDNLNDLFRDGACAEDEEETTTSSTTTTDSTSTSTSDTTDTTTATTTTQTTQPTTTTTTTTTTPPTTTTTTTPPGGGGGGGGGVGDG